MSPVQLRERLVKIDLVHLRVLHVAEEDVQQRLVGSDRLLRDSLATLDDATAGGAWSALTKGARMISMIALGLPNHV